MTVEEFMAAVTLFKLPEQVTLRELKARHRELVRKYHPDGHGVDDAAIRDINAAYTLLSGYCAEYKYRFSAAEFLEQYPRERLRQQFGWDPVWGGGKPD